MRSLMFACAALLAAVMAVPADAGDLSPAANAAYLQTNRAKPGVKVTASGLQYRVLKSGTGRTPKSTDMVRVIYKGMLIDGTVFDETKPGQPPAEFPAGKLIAGWVEALSMMKEGDRWELVIPANLAYGERGTPGGPIPPNQVLIFEMELLKVL